MRKTVLIVLLFIVGYSSYGQVVIESENLSLKMVKARRIGAFSVQFGGTYNILSGKDDKRVQVRLKLRSLDGKETMFDPNKLSLVSDGFKARFSVSEALFATFFRSKGFQLLTTNNTEKPIFATYDPSIKNTFNEYSINGFKDCAVNLNFGTKRKPIIHTIYLKPNFIDKNVLDIYFIVPNELKNAKLYFGNTLISEIKIH
ncbi:hypothetical protein [Aequorivita marina]|uniref:hypothetical protein n=1 Tax=Aequorivita marina TaxID=3073654 RepID=UPI002876F88E|nr:hypothetical protein [Aequorivita sp. S2608]MDS1297937.1 hypothetical protein [Aequorivita sp. S2608]